MLIKEFCAENFTLVPQAIGLGAKRIELCDNLAVGGTTPSTGVIEETIHYAHEKNASVVTMIRPRSGDFVYNDTELRIMETDLIEAKKLETDGVVFGCLTLDHQLDKEANMRLIQAAEGLQITFHMAFDELDLADQLTAIDWLAEQGIDRILTHGGSNGTPIADNFFHLKSLIAHAKSRLTILPGGGITHQNAEKIVKVLGVKEVHGTKIIDLNQ